jgi:thiol-disulfide isomerase/thioredoxin
MAPRLCRAAGVGLYGVLLGCALRHDPPTVTLRPVHFDLLKQELTSLKVAIVFVDVWATWCAPCIERFPHMVDLSRRYESRGVTFISMNVDNREDKAAVEAAQQFLLKQRAIFRNYLMDENILDAFQDLGVQGIPAVFMYDRTGRQRYFLNADDPNRQFTTRDVDDALSTLVSEPVRKGVS